MSKILFTKLSIIAVFIFTTNVSNVFAQTSTEDLNRIEIDSIFSWKLVEIADPSSQSSLNFIPRVGIVPISWDFGDGNNSTENSPTHIYNYTSWDDSITVSLSYTLDGANLSHSRRIPLSPAFFWILPDSSLGRLASYKRIFRSNFRFDNFAPSPGNLHFEWSLDGTVLTGNAFTPSTLGQWPNIYYTFATGGIHQVKLTVYNTSNSTNIAEFTSEINIIPTLTATKEKLINIPNVFTPNGDGANDEFEVLTTGTAQFVLRVLSRSGGLLYQNESSIIRWDGRNAQGNDLPEGIYYYIIEDITGLYESATGFVYIFRGKK